MERVRAIRTDGIDKRSDRYKARKKESKEKEKKHVFLVSGENEIRGDGYIDTPASVVLQSICLFHRLFRQVHPTLT